VADIRHPVAAAFALFLVMGVAAGCGGSDAGGEGGDAGALSAGEGQPGGAGVADGGLPPVPQGLLQGRVALAPGGGLLLVECAPDGTPRSPQPRAVEDGTGGELSLMVRAFGAPRDGVPVWVALSGDVVTELRIIVPEGAGCPPILPPDAQVVGSGNEPFWQVRILRNVARILTPDAPEGVEYAEGQWTEDDGVWQFEASRDFVDGMDWIALKVFPIPCIDDMSGGRYPWTVLLTWDGKELDGCGWEGGAHPGISRGAGALEE